jgi:hypothetical protein
MVEACHKPKHWNHHIAAKIELFQNSKVSLIADNILEAAKPSDGSEARNCSFSNPAQ